MNKKIISLVLALVMVLGTFTSVFAEAAPKADAKKTEETKKTEVKKAEAGEKVEKVVGKDNKIQYIVDKKLVEGYEDGNLGLDKNIKRSEITRLLVLANGNEELAKQLQGSMKIYSDVDAKHWANGVISVGTTVPSDANGIAMLAGYPDGSFKPENDVTYAELAKMLVVLAKKDLTADMVKNAKWATDWMTWAAQLGILDDVNVVDSNKAANRADAFTMVYNALYVMKEFKRVPANETRGIISNLTKDVLTLNQDSKMEYKVNADTVFVTGKDAQRQQIVRLSALDLKTDDYYLGSLVRILTNEKNEVTHIIELGNPAELARNNAAGKVVENGVWRGVADYTVETANPVAKTALEAQKALNLKKDAYAKVEFNDNNVDAKRITFYNVNNVEGKTVTLKINKDTEFYVANPANNQMRKVANVNEALALIGYHNYDKYELAGVYAGFNNDGVTANYKAIKPGADRNTAKVVVFNFVNKAAEGEKFRVIESSSSKFMTTLEKTDGTLVDRNNVYDTSRFPLEYGDKLDVIELDTVREGSIYKTLIDHSKTSVYPIVKITRVDADKNFIVVEDKEGDTSLLDIREADIFSAKRYGKLEVGTSIQFRVKDADKTFANYAQADNNEAEIISLLGDAKLDGVLANVIPSAEKVQRTGHVVDVKNVNGVWHMVAKVDRDIFEEVDRDGHATYIVANEDVDALKEAKRLGTYISFKVFERNNNGLYIATDIRYNDGKQNQLAGSSEARIAEAKRLMERAINLEGKAKYADIKAAEDAYKNLKKTERSAIDNNAQLVKDYQDAKEIALATQKKDAEASIKAFLDKFAEESTAVAKLENYAGLNAEEVKASRDRIEELVALNTETNAEIAKFEELNKAAHKSETLKDAADYKQKVEWTNNRINAFNRAKASENAYANVATIDATLVK